MSRRWDRKKKMLEAYRVGKREELEKLNNFFYRRKPKLLPRFIWKIILKWLFSK